MKKRTRRVFAPKEKINAVLSVWTECKSATQVCKDMSISWTLLEKWQDQAMEGIVKSLSPGKTERKATINTRLARLIEKKMNGTAQKLEKRLKKIQSGAT